ncbi:uncharacterized protein LOC131935927 [Physella acuta]|uniref:uncharacterized protein LOC131935927 n=1 Tax=Physella acuta TaxID=109671 RepID=UPI0027DE2777|nr:uncharacterized protein LOC131935927 [Physella acuta]
MAAIGQHEDEEKYAINDKLGYDEASCVVTSKHSNKSRGRPAAETLLGDLNHPREKNTQSIMPQNRIMKNVRICYTLIDEQEKVKISQLVKEMGGDVDDEITDDSTHMIVERLGAIEYFQAIARKMPVMIADWIFTVYEASKLRNVNPIDAYHLNYFKCPPFLGLTIALYGFSNTEYFKRKIALNGGKVLDKLDQCTHLVLNDYIDQSLGRLLEAQENEPIIIPREWLTDCLKEKSYLNPLHYKVYITNPPAKNQGPTNKKRYFNEYGHEIVYMKAPMFFDPKEIDDFMKGVKAYEDQKNVSEAEKPQTVNQQTTKPGKMQSEADDIDDTILEFVQKAYVTNLVKVGVSAAKASLKSKIPKFIVMTKNALSTSHVFELHELCKAKAVPYVFVVSKEALGQACNSRVPVTACSILNINSNANFESDVQKLMKLQSNTAAKVLVTELVSFTQHVKDEQK